MTGATAEVRLRAWRANGRDYLYVRWLLALNDDPDLRPMETWRREGSAADAIDLGEVVSRNVLEVIRREVPGGAVLLDTGWTAPVDETGEVRRLRRFIVGSRVA